MGGPEPLSEPRTVTLRFSFHKFGGALSNVLYALKKRGKGACSLQQPSILNIISSDIQQMVYKNIFLIKPDIKIARGNCQNWETVFLSLVKQFGKGARVWRHFEIWGKYRQIESAMWA